MLCLSSSTSARKQTGAKLETGPVQVGGLNCLLVGQTGSLPSGWSNSFIVQTDQTTRGELRAALILALAKERLGQGVSSLHAKLAG